jgi:hypothetical protein
VKYQGNLCKASELNGEDLMSNNTQVVELEKGKSLILTVREDRLVSKIDVFIDNQLQASHHKPYGITKEEAIREYS